VLLLFFSIAMALVFQYGIAPAIVDANDLTSFVRDKWTDGCSQYVDIDVVKSCAGNNGVYRVSAASTLFFAFAALGALLKPTANREAWPAKYTLYFFLCIVTIFIPNDPLFSDAYLNIARIGAVLFIVVQQLVIVDMAHEWNDSWVAKADAAEAQEAGSGKRWLGAIVTACIMLFGISIIAIGVIFSRFTGCGTNNGFITVTLVLGVSIVGAQMSGEEGSLLASACVFAWSVFLCYTAVSKNPDASCNPMLGEMDTVSIVLGLTVTAISLGWTGWSYTAEDKLRSSSEEESAAAATARASDDSAKDVRRDVTGVVTGNDYGTQDDEEQANSAGHAEVDESVLNNPSRLSNSWKLNAILMSVSCWKAMALTNWGAIVANGNAANPQVGRVGMWMVIASQWLVLTLYLWTLLAPRLFPNREFG
jgi:hypothetical protein